MAAALMAKIVQITTLTIMYILAILYMRPEAPVMFKITATELKNNTAEALANAQRGAVHIERNGKPAAVLLSADEYQRLSKCDDHVWGAAALRAEKGGYVSPQESLAALNKLMREEEQVDSAELHKSSPRLSPRSRGKAAPASKLKNSQALAKHAPKRLRKA